MVHQGARRRGRALRWALRRRGRHRYLEPTDSRVIHGAFCVYVACRGDAEGIR